METGTLYELLGRMYDDLFPQNKETRPLQDCAGTGGNRGKRRNGETTQWTVRLDSTGGISTTAHGKRGTTPCTGESHMHDTGISPKNIAEAKQRSTPIMGLDLNSGLGPKGANEQVEEPFVGEFHISEQKKQDTKWKLCNGKQTVPRSQQCKRNRDLRISHHKAPRARWITGWDLSESITS